MRKNAVAAVQSGESPEHVAKVFNVHRSRVYEWLAWYRSGGWDALKDNPRKGRPSKLKGGMMKWVYKAITGGTPLNYRFEFALWTRKQVAMLIERQFGIQLSVTSVGRLLGQLGLSVQKPLFRASERDESKVEFFLNQKYPMIKKLAKRMGAEIWFQDESGVSAVHNKGTTWGKKGETPVVNEGTGARARFNIISAITARGELRFTVVEGRVASDVFIEFLKKMMADSSKPIIMIVDGASFHKSKKTRQYVRSQGDNLKMFFLPPYAPELNPDEQVWNQLKSRIGKAAIEGKVDLKAKIYRFMFQIQKSIRLIRSFFSHKDTKYAAV